MWKVLDEGIVKIKPSENSNKNLVELIMPKEIFCEAYNKFCEELPQQKKYSDINKNRALIIAKKYIPKKDQSMYQEEICRGCVHNACVKEQKECCICEDGSFYENYEW